MSKVCELTGKGPFTGNLVSHSNRKARTRWLPNLKRKKYFVDRIGQNVTLTLCTRAIRTIDKQGGIQSALLKAKEEKLSPRLAKIRRSLKQKPQAAKSAS